MNRSPVVFAIALSLIALVLAGIWVTRYRQETKPRSRLMAQTAPETRSGAPSASPGAPPSAASGGSMAPIPSPPGPGAPAGMPFFSPPGGASMMGRGDGEAQMEGEAMSGGFMGGSPMGGRRFSYVGTIQPADTVTVNSPIAGTVTEVSVKDGDTVRAGQTLLRLAGLESGQRSAVVKAPQRGLVVALRAPGDSPNPALETLLGFPHVGQRADAGTPLLDIVNDQSAVVPLNVSERDVIFVKPGQPVLIRLRVLPQVTLKGKIVRVGRIGQPRGAPSNVLSTAVFPVIVQVLDPLDRVRFGMSAEVEWSEEPQDAEASAGASSASETPPEG